MFRSRLITAVVTAATAVMVAAPVAAHADAQAGSPTGTQAAPYHFVGRPILLYGHRAYDIFWRLDRDLPRTGSRRALAQPFLNGNVSGFLFGGGRRQPCFETHWDRTPVGPPRFGALYTFELRIPGADSLVTHVRLGRHTQGYNSFLANGIRDPKVRALCPPHKH
jgi:hypothetical protein